MTAGFVGLVCLLAGMTIGWLWRSERVWQLEQRNTELLDDLDAAVRDISYTLGRQHHPAGRALRVVREAER